MTTTVKLLLQCPTKPCGSVVSPHLHGPKKRAAASIMRRETPRKQSGSCRQKNNYQKHSVVLWVLLPKEMIGNSDGGLVTAVQPE
jgi:hypothetical protein